MSQTIKAFAIRKIGPAEVIEEITVPKPTVSDPFDIVVQVKAVSVNPVDTKRRSSPGYTPSVPEPIILGYDASGIVSEVGSSVTRFKVGDEVAYAGNMIKNGSNAEYQVVDSKIVGRKAKTVGWADAASYPLVGLTAWEGLFEQLEVDPQGGDKGKSILVIGGAGGVGSLVIQIAKKIAGLTVIATASRPESTAFAQKLGADHVISHKEPLRQQLEKLGFKNVDLVYNTQNVAPYWDQVADVLVPTGKVVLINSEPENLSINPYFFKRLTITHEFMFARPIHNAHPEKQGPILDKIADAIDSKVIQVTTTSTQKLTLENLRNAHRQLESGTTTGKITLEW